MKSLLRNSRFYILLFSIIGSLTVFISASFLITSPTLQLTRLEEVFGVSSIIYLYIALITGPLSFRLKGSFVSPILLHGRRAIGVGAFYFALLHTLLTFFGQLGGFEGLAFLNTSYQIALTLGVLSLCILFFLTITSIDIAVKKMGFKNWKLLHRFVYLGTILILMHILLLGVHFAELSGIVAQITFFALAILLYLEAPRIDEWLQSKFSNLPTFGLGTTIILIGLFLIYFIVIAPIFSFSGGGVSFDLHATHRLLAQNAAQNQVTISSNNKALQIPGLQGDRNLRYTVTWNNPQNVQPNQPTELDFQVYDAQNGEPVSYFKTPYSKVMHVIVVSSDLTYFVHVHPTQNGYIFSLPITFPSDGVYHIYVDFQPWNAIEQQVAFTLSVGTGTTVKAVQKPDANMTKTFGNYEVTLDTHGQLSAEEMTFGNQTISFTVKDATTHKPIKTLKPYLASFGHLVMIDETTYNYLHAHPYLLVAPLPNANGGSTVDFLPIGIYGPIHPGTYRLFAQFNPDNNLFTANFTVKVGK